MFSLSVLNSDVLSLSRAQIQQDLEMVLAQRLLPETLLAAVRHAVLLGGKRVRPALCYAACEALGQPVNAAARRAAVAVELIHCYSLVHDDLPCMDDDALRRGQPTCHIQFGEATALLAGDVLQSLAFEVLSHDYFTDKATGDGLMEATQQLIAAQQIALLARRSSQMVAGQVLDLAAEQQQVDEPSLREIHLNKTGALIDAAIQMGAVAAGCGIDSAQMKQLSAFGYALGLAFQVQDDVLDVTASTAVLGKPAGSDQKLQKSTYPSLLGLAAAQQLAVDLHQQALAAIENWETSALGLRQIAAFLLHRQS
ncbi:MAG: farnesyl diphosphate synthase [Pseudomonadota bacterium]|nr:farnesyl diphosphate synthase [Pseudomonadota bacterium]